MENDEYRDGLTDVSAEDIREYGRLCNQENILGGGVSAEAATLRMKLGVTHAELWQLWLDMEDSGESS